MRGRVALFPTESEDLCSIMAVITYLVTCKSSNREGHAAANGCLYGPHYLVFHIERLERVRFKSSRRGTLSA